LIGSAHDVSSPQTEKRLLVLLGHSRQGFFSSLLEVRVETKTYSLGLPLEWEGDDIPDFKKVFLVIDVDRYEHNVAAAGLRIQDWITSTTSSIRSDVVAALEELCKP